jgi:hypothetical protein
MNSVRQKTCASNEPICKEEKAEFLIAQIANDCFDCFDCNELFFPLVTGQKKLASDRKLKL